MAKHARLIKQIKAAFADTQYPGDDKIVDLHGITQIDDYIQTAENFKGKTWQSCTAEFFDENYDNIFFFSPIGFAYYLPAFLLAGLELATRPAPFNDSNFPDAVLHTLTPPNDPKLDDLLAQRVQQLNKPQKLVIYNYMVAFLKIDPDVMKLNEAHAFWKLTSETNP